MLQFGRAFVRFVAAGLLAACTSNRETVRAKAAERFHCPERSVTIVEQRDDIGEPTYEVDACDHLARYTCHDRRRSVVESERQAGGCSLDLEYPSR